MMMLGNRRLAKLGAAVVTLLILLLVSSSGMENNQMEEARKGFSLVRERESDEVCVDGGGVQF
eukprot:scaffold24278_cov178-Amphora_coffeaeformis.AAC.1